VPDDDDAAMAAQVIRFVDQPALARRLAAAARATCAAYEWPVVRDQWLAAYQSVRRPAGPPPSTVSCVEPPAGFKTSR